MKAKHSMDKLDTALRQHITNKAQIWWTLNLWVSRIRWFSNKVAVLVALVCKV